MSIEELSSIDVLSGSPDLSTNNSFETVDVDAMPAIETMSEADATFLNTSAASDGLNLKALMQTADNGRKT